MTFLNFQNLERVTALKTAVEIMSHTLIIQAALATCHTGRELQVELLCFRVKLNFKVRSLCIFTRGEGGRRLVARQIGRPASLGCSLTCRSSETRALYFWSEMQAGGGCGSTSYNLTRSAWSDVERATSGRGEAERQPRKEATAEVSRLAA